jgi:hypothetical protein
MKKLLLLLSTHFLFVSVLCSQVEYLKIDERNMCEIKIGNSSIYLFLVYENHFYYGYNGCDIFVLTKEIGEVKYLEISFSSDEIERLIKPATFTGEYFMKDGIYYTKGVYFTDEQMLNISRYFASMTLFINGWCNEKKMYEPINTNSFLDKEDYDKIRNFIATSYKERKKE